MKTASHERTYFRPESERAVVIEDEDAPRILAADPSFVAIGKAAYFDNYDLPCPIRVEVRTKSGGTSTVVLRRARHGNIAEEIAIFAALGEYGLPVPEVLGGPFVGAAGKRFALYSLLRGENLQVLSMRSEEGLTIAKRLLIEAVERLATASQFLAHHEVGKRLPRHTLQTELESVACQGNPWLAQGVTRDAIARLTPIVKEVQTPLVLTNGDYQPGNFLAEHGSLTGFLDFESSSFQDPLMGFVKYPIYDLRPLARTDLIELFASRNGFTPDDFRIRLALGCLKVLKNEIPVAGGDQKMEAYRGRVLEILESAV